MPSSELEETNRKYFWGQVDRLIQKISGAEKTYIGIDFKWSYRKNCEMKRHKMVYESNGLERGVSQVMYSSSFVLLYDFVVGNNCFRKNEGHLNTFKSYYK